MATREALIADIARVQSKANDPTTQAYFQKNYGGVDAYITSQTNRLNQLSTPSAPTQAAPNQQPVRQHVQQPVQQGMSAQEVQRMINAQYEAERAVRLKQLQAQRDQQIQGLGSMRQDITGEYAGLRTSAEGQKTEIGQQFQGLRGQADAQAMIAANRLQELMAARGLAAGGENVSASANLEAQRMGNLTALDQDESNRMRDIADYMNRLTEQEQARYRDIDDRIAGLNDPRELEAIELAMDAERNRSLQDAYWRQQAADFQREQFGWQQGIDQRNFDYNVDRDTRRDFESDRSYNLQLSELEWQRNANNPQVQAQMLSNEIARIQLQNLPEQMKLQLEQMKRQIQTMGSSGRTPQQIQMDQINLERAKIQLQQIQQEASMQPWQKQYNAAWDAYYKGSATPQQLQLIGVESQGQGNTVATYQQSLSQMTPAQAFSNLTQYKDDIVRDIGPEEYLKLYNLYKNVDSAY